jgi:hypothetical protein
MPAEPVDPFEALRQSAIEVEDVPAARVRLARQIEVRAVREGFRYWIPGLLGAGLACLVVIAFFMVATRSPDLSRPPAETGATASRAADPAARLVLPPPALP